MKQISIALLLALLFSSCEHQGIYTKYRYTVQITYIDGYVDTVVEDIEDYRTPPHQYHDEVSLGAVTYYNVLRFKVLSKEELTNLEKQRDGK
jgi:hypothetical protein